MLKLRPELATDGATVDRLLDLCFGPDRGRKISYRYRVAIDPIWPLCAVAESAGMFVGAIRYWPAALNGEATLLLGPLAIDPGLRNQGIGQLLVDATLARARDLGWRLVFLVGDIDYYSRFGFSTVPASIVMPGEDPARLQWRRLDPQGSALPAAGSIVRATPDMVSRGGLPQGCAPQRMTEKSLSRAASPIAQDRPLAYQVARSGA